ncbi:MAG: retropepsin-like domain-containing protein [Pirellulales bacterium]|nr:retropepsin-like domain-containing protein [Pirellulales bacterium]
MRHSILYFCATTALLCAAAAVKAEDSNFVIPLDTVLDEAGEQIEVIQGYYQLNEGAGVLEYRYTGGIYDTGASVITLGYSAQEMYKFLSIDVPIKVSGGARAEGVDGPVIGDVSEAGIVVSDGLHALSIDINTLSFNFDLNYQGTGDGPYAAVVPGVQMFVGTDPGSASLPTISGTPIHYSQNHPGGTAAYINKQGYMLDLHEWFPDIIPDTLPYYMADLEFVNSGTKLEASSDPNVSGPFRIPLTMIGDDNYADPGNEMTYSANPFVSNVGVTMNVEGTEFSVAEKTFLFDTGAMISVISTELESELGLDSSMATHTIEVSGAAGAIIPLHGYDLTVLDLPYDNNGTTGFLQFENAPVFVLDVGEGIDGILGMNLFNTAKEMLYDPNDPDGASLQLTFDTSEREDVPFPDPSESEYTLLYEIYSELFMLNAGYLPGVVPVPEPGTFVLLAVGGALLLARRRLRRKARV